MTSALAERGLHVTTDGTLVELKGRPRVVWWRRVWRWLATPMTEQEAADNQAI